eukprot:TRINITY_DN23167_c0_g1_i1.p1 TRINITY_DN23167_c0_g1~~TRINITY_DN23167_c0_g1_i1.p1  ORF type:complete len:339 (+),score=79.72 TRINITY_DN23167_c0_g1_i1:113-1018(+)
MLFVLSAASKVRVKPVAECVQVSVPRLAAQAKSLVAEMRRREAKVRTEAGAGDWRGEGYHQRAIKKHLHMSRAAAKRSEPHLGFAWPSMTTQPAAACTLYDSPFYDGLDAAALDEEDAEWANDHVRILSALYGVVRPFDEIVPPNFPLSLGTKVANSGGKYLSDYWKESIAQELEDSVRTLPRPLIVNCVAEQDQDVLQANLPPYADSLNVMFRMKPQGSPARAMGEFVNWALRQRCSTFRELNGFSGVSSSVSRAPSADGTLLFVEKGNARGGPAAAALPPWKSSRRGRTAPYDREDFLA